MPLSDISPRHLEMLRLAFRLLRKATATELAQAWRNREGASSIEAADKRIADLEQVMLDMHPLGVMLHAEPESPKGPKA